jgi:hypothetical protein
LRSGVRSLVKSVSGSSMFYIGASARMVSVLLVGRGKINICEDIV